jgi:glycosyltransferase involved in cell wall biosynthesis
VIPTRRGPDAILPNPIEIDDALASGAPRSTKDVVYTGTLTPKKGVISLIDAWPAVQARCPGAHLHMFGKDGHTAGSESMQAALESQLPQQLRSTVTFYGHTPRETLMTRLKSARLAVFPSFAEACAIAPLEAMACGCPTVTSARGSGPELMKHDRDALLVDPADTTGIADAVIRILTNDRLAARLGKAGRDHVRRLFSMDVLLPRNIEFYRRCIDQFASVLRSPSRGTVEAA